MKKSIFSAFAALAAVALFSGSAAAENFYVGAQIGQSTISVPGLTSNRGTELGLNVGYQVNQNFAVEGAYVDLGKGAAGATQYKANLYSLSAVGSMPVAEKCSVFGKLGYAATTTRVTGLANANRSGVTFGLGAKYAVSDAVDVVAGYDRYKVGNAVTGSGNVGVWNLGAAYKF